MLADLRRGVAAGEPAEDRQTTVGTLLLRWLAAQSVGPSSFVRYEGLVRLQLAGLASVRAQRLTPEHVRAHLRTLRSSPATIGAALRILRAALALAVSDGTLERNVALAVKAPPSAPSTSVALAADQARALLETSRETSWYPLWALLLGTGLRMGEALGLRWTDLSGGMLTVSGAIRHQPRSQRGTGPRLARVEPKTERSRRVVALPAFVVVALSELSHDALYVFHRGNGKPLNPSTVQRAFAAATVGLPRVRLHDCRHTAATLMLASGASLDDVKRALGHTSIAITSDVYGHLVEGRARELAARLNEAIGGMG
jgi:integrase